MLSRVSLLIVVFLLATPAAPARGEDPLVERVRLAIKNGKGYLLGRQRDNGSWENDAAVLSHKGGETSLAILALLTAGESSKSEAIQKGLKYLRGIPPGQTYVVALQTMAFAQAGEM